MNIINILHNKNISQYAFSKECGVPYTTICDICKGKTELKKCNAETVLKIAKTLGLTVEDLLTEDHGEAEIDDSIPPYTKNDYYKLQMKFRKNAILRSESALEYLNLTDMTFSHIIKVYSTVNLPFPFIVTKVKNFKDIDYMSVDGVLVTTVSKSIDDMISDKESDKQILDQAMNNYYYRNNESFDGINVSKNNLEKFEQECKTALEYYDN